MDRIQLAQAKIKDSVFNSSIANAKKQLKAPKMAHYVGSDNPIFSSIEEVLLRLDFQIKELPCHDLCVLSEGATVTLDDGNPFDAYFVFM
jgi:hypothetical protein